MHSRIKNNHTWPVVFWSIRALWAHLFLNCNVYPFDNHFMKKKTTLRVTFLIIISVWNWRCIFFSFFLQNKAAIQLFIILIPDCYCIFPFFSHHHWHLFDALLGTIVAQSTQVHNTKHKHTSFISQPSKTTQHTTATKQINRHTKK